MERQKRKKGKMQAAKLFIITIMLYCMVFECHSQTLSGHYFTKSGLSSGEFRFHENHTFTNITGNALEHVAFYKKGYYLFQQDTLILFCDSVPDARVSSEFQVVEKADSSQNPFGNVINIPQDRADITALIKDEKGQPVKGATIAYMNDDDIVFAEISDPNGRFSISTEGRFIESILISYIGYEELRINTNPFWGYWSSVEVRLQPVSSVKYVNSCLEKYLVKRNTSNELHLITLDARKSKILLIKK